MTLATGRHLFALHQALELQAGDSIESSQQPVS